MKRPDREGRQRSPATGFKKPRKQSLSGGWVILYFFFYFSVALVVKGGEKPAVMGFCPATGSATG